MTNIVKKGTNRPAHYARVNKHAQRTPLPPRTPVPADPPARTSAAVLKEAVEGARHAAGEAKAQEFAEYLNQRGWRATADRREDGVWTTTGRRKTPVGEETLFASWVNGKVTIDNVPIHTLDGASRRLKNVSAAKHVADIVPAEVTPWKAPKPARARRADPEPVGADAATVERVPFFAADAADSEIVDAIVGRRLTWARRLKPDLESATVVGSARNIRVRGEGEDRYVEFNTEEGPMYAIFVNAIVEVR